MEDDDENVFAISIIDRYSARPQQLQDICLAHFAVTYSPKKTQTITDSDDETTEETDHSIELNNNLGTMTKNLKRSVLRYHHHSKLKEAEKYYYTQLLLFLPWTDEQQLLELASYKQHYDQYEHIIEENRSELEHHADIIAQAVEHFEEFGPPVHAFETVAPATVQENDDDQVVVEDEEFAILDPSDGIHNSQSLTEVPVNSTSSITSLEIRPGFWAEDQYRNHIRNLNTEQRDTFQTVYKWCQQKVQSQRNIVEPDQLLLFISGGAGTGKSHLISAIYQMALRTLQVEGQNPDNIRVLLTAPTGTAAHNIAGTTLHSAFLLPLGQTKSYIKLSDDKRNTLRTKAGHLDLLIVDEISMVGSDLLLQLHYRLTEIKSSTKLFGGISLIVLGDLYQLRPVKQKFVFEPVLDHVARLHGSLWNCFMLTELNKIMRQKEDLHFAELLNRIRIGSHTENDIKLLESRKISQNDKLNSYLHVYARNSDVDHFNSEQLVNLQQPVQTYTAIDKRPESLKNFEIKNDSKFTGGLPCELTLALGARVMLIRNIDVADGLVNGSQGQIVAFIKSGKGDTVAIAIKFDNQNVGLDTRRKSPYMLQLKAQPDSTPILRSETTFTVTRKNNSLTVYRYQFPLKLAWACTIHKVQGLTMDNIVVSFDGRFGGGQAYVALSRSKSLTGLHIISLDTSKIKVNKQVQKEMNRLRSERALGFYYDFFSLWKDALVASALNIRSFSCHKQDLLCDPIAIQSDVVVISETWLNDNNADFTDFEANNYICRSDKDGEHGGRGGGVALLAKKSAFTNVMPVSAYSSHVLQVLTCELKTTSSKTIYVIAVYNSPMSVKTRSSLETQILSHLQEIAVKECQAQVVITGDFNQNAIAQPPPNICETLSAKGFQQYIYTPTHMSGSCLDHIYLTELVAIAPRTTLTYYSDHAWVSCGVVRKN